MDSPAKRNSTLVRGAGGVRADEAHIAYLMEQAIVTFRRFGTQLSRAQQVRGILQGLCDAEYDLGQDSAEAIAAALAEKLQKS